MGLGYVGEYGEYFISHPPAAETAHTQILARKEGIF